MNSQLARKARLFKRSKLAPHGLPLHHAPYLTLKMLPAQPKQEDELDTSDYDAYSEDDEEAGPSSGTPRQKVKAAPSGFMPEVGLIKGALMPYIPVQVSQRRTEAGDGC